MPSFMTGKKMIFRILHGPEKKHRQWIF